MGRGSTMGMGSTMVMGSTLGRGSNMGMGSASLTNPQIVKIDSRSLRDMVQEASVVEK